MNDFDFEELDKAVTELATKTHDEHGNAIPVAPRSVSPAPLTPPRPAEPEKPALAPERPQPAEPTTSVPVKHRLETTRPRPRGSFMDIVPPAQRKVTPRVGVSIQPVSKLEEIVPESGNLEPQSPEPHKSAESEMTKSPQATHEPPAFKPDEPTPARVLADDVAWPDPLDFNDGPRPDKSERGAINEPAPESVSEPTSEPESKEPPAEPTSPFLAEAKVEKRPLGAFSNFKPAAEPRPATPEEVLTPAEAKADELTPEDDGTFKEPDKAPLPPKEGEEHKQKPEDTKPDLHSAAMMSIPQQYRTEAKAADKSPRPVYDTKEYHPPLIEAASHEHRGGGSMWGKLFIALVVLALLAVGGYFIYVYFVQT